MLGIRSTDTDSPEQVGFVRTSEHVAGAVEHLADLDPAAKQLVAGGFDVGDNQIQSLGGARRRRGDVLAEDDRAPGARRGELYDPILVALGELGVEPPPKVAVKTLGAIEVGNRDDDNLELEVGAAHLSTAHF